MASRAVRERQLHTVYLLRDKDGTVIYVGVTAGLEARLRQHRYKPWWPEVARVDTEFIAGKPRAALRELDLIHEHEPRYNDQGTEVSRERAREQWRRWRESRDAIA